jgi:two-component system, NarL family, response regulator LiaR
VEPSDNALRVVLADDHHFFREGLRGMLEADGMAVVGEATDGAVALERELAPDIVVIDLKMPKSSGIDALRQILAASPHAHVVVLTVSADQADVLEALTARELEVIRLIADGSDNAAIGRELSISRHTVKQYVTNIFEKLGVHSRVQAAVYAVRKGLV